MPLWKSSIFIGGRSYSEYWLSQAQKPNKKIDMDFNPLFLMAQYCRYTQSVLMEFCEN
jgi:hypothetical protein